jgi:hypothetical protein
MPRLCSGSRIAKAKACRKTIRVGELCKLRIENISPDASSFRIHGKGSRDRVAYVADADHRANYDNLSNSGGLCMRLARFF